MLKHMKYSQLNLLLALVFFFCLSFIYNFGGQPNAETYIKFEPRKPDVKNYVSLLRGILLSREAIGGSPPTFSGTHPEDGNCSGFCTNGKL